MRLLSLSYIHSPNFKPTDAAAITIGYAMSMMRKHLGTILVMLGITLALCSADSEYSGVDEEELGGGQMTYDQALMKAQKGQADDEVLAAFRKGLSDALDNTDQNFIDSRKTNLAAILLDLGNKQGVQEEWEAMYREARKLSHEVLANNPDDESAAANLKAALTSIEYRQKQAKAKDAPPRTAADLARQALLDDDDDDDEADQNGEDDDDDDDQNGDDSFSDAMSYEAALQEAQKGQMTQELLAVFRAGLEEVSGSDNKDLIKFRKINLAAALLDLAKLESEPDTWKSMYNECIQRADEVLAEAPDDENALSNKNAALGWLDHRTSQLEARKAAEFEESMMASSSPSDGLSDKQRAQMLLMDDDDDEDEL